MLTFCHQSTKVFFLLFEVETEDAFFLILPTVLRSCPHTSVVLPSLHYETVFCSKFHLKYN